jgi:hypothetical protein
MTATREAREILVLFARIGMDDTSRFEVYAERLKKREQAERRIRNALLRQSEPGACRRPIAARLAVSLLGNGGFDRPGHVLWWRSPASRPPRFVRA